MAPRRDRAHTPESLVRAGVEVAIDRLLEAGEAALEAWRLRQMTAKGRKRVRSAYEVLGVSLDDPLDLVWDVYRAKAKYLHPDNLATGDEQAFKELKAAWDHVQRVRNGGALDF